MARGDPASVVVALRDLVVSGEMQLRAVTRPDVVNRYAQAMKAGQVFPPLEVADVGGVLRLIDGFHRVEALKALGVREAAARVHQVGTLEEARWLAGKANLAHGLPLKAAERRAVFRAYVGASQHREGGRRRGRLKSYREISKALGMAHTTLRNWTRSDFPTVFAAMKEGGELGGERGGLRERATAGAVCLREAVEGLDAAGAALGGVLSAADRGFLLGRVEALRAALLAAGVEEVEEQPF